MGTWIGNNLRGRRALSLKKGSGSPLCTHRPEPISLKYVLGGDYTDRKHPTAS